MKKLLIICLVCLLTHFIQEEPLSKIANIKTPESSQKLSREQGEAIMKKDFKYGGINVTKGKKNVFEKNGIIIVFSDSANDPQNRTLEQIKAQEMEQISQMGLEIAKGIIEAKIVSINNINFYISKRCVKEEYYYNFISERKDFKAIYGTLVFKKDKLEEADKIFNNLIKSISFKKL